LVVCCGENDDGMEVEEEEETKWLITRTFFVWLEVDDFYWKVERKEIVKKGKARRVWWCGVSCINKHSSIRELGMSLEFNCKSRHGWFHTSPFSMLCLFYF
jgi:hypothetical protein